MILKTEIFVKMAPFRFFFSHFPLKKTAENTKFCPEDYKGATNFMVKDMDQFFVIISLLQPKHRIFCTSTICSPHFRIPTTLYLDMDLKISDVQKKFFGLNKSLLKRLDEAVGPTFQSNVHVFLEKHLEYSCSKCDIFYYVAAAHRFDSAGMVAKLSYRITCNICFSDMKFLNMFVMQFRLFEDLRPLEINFLGQKMQIPWTKIVDTGVYALKGRQLLRPVYMFKTGCPNSLFQVVDANFSVDMSYHFNLAHPQNVSAWGSSILKIPAQFENTLKTSMSCTSKLSSFLYADSASHTFVADHFNYELTGMEKHEIKHAILLFKDLYEELIQSLVKQCETETIQPFFISDKCEVEKFYHGRHKSYFGFVIKEGFFSCHHCRNQKKKAFFSISKTQYFGVCCSNTACDKPTFLSMRNYATEPKFKCLRIFYNLCFS